jgi:hypothetical protein
VSAELVSPGVLPAFTQTVSIVIDVFINAIIADCPNGVRVISDTVLLYSKKKGD